MQERMQELVSLLNGYAEAYYAFDAPKVSDAEYDALFDELLALEKETGTVLPDSPTAKVGSAPLAAFEEHRHIARLWSMDKVRTKEALIEWGKRAERLRAEYNAANGAELPPVSYALEYKFDGLTVNLTYENGLLVQGATRGKGTVGEAILPQIKTVRDIPHTIPFKGKMEVQGECYMRLSVLKELNREGDEQLKNARNAAAGALRNLDPKITAKRKLSCYLYNVGHMEGETLSEQGEMLAFLRENGLPTSPFYKTYGSIEAVYEGIAEAEENRDNLDFLIDGMVIKVRDFATREALGNTDRFPRWAIAFKFAAEETTTTVRDVTWEVGRTGKLTPRAHLAPVELAGATISHATLNNYDDILRKRVGIGSRVFLRRSNDVIPEILGAVEGDIPLMPVEKPVRCPACGAHVEHRGVHLYCTNSLSCRPQIAARLSHYASRDAMDIETFSDKTAVQLVEQLGLSSIADLYDLGAQEFLALPGFKEKKVQNLLNALEASKHRSLGAFLFAVGIPNVGAKTARDLARRFLTLEGVRSASFDALVAVEDIGDIVANSIIDFFRDPSISAEIDRLLDHGVSPVPEEAAGTESPIAGKTLVVTGTMERMGRKEIEALIERLGGKAAGSVSKKTDYVVAGESAGSKLEKARTLGIRVLSEQEFFDLVEEK